MPAAAPRVASLTEGLAHPLYFEAYKRIADEIASGALRPGDPLPSERLLCERLGVSRATVRRAVRKLVEDGLVESIPHRGSFVSSEPVSEPPNVLMSFAELAVTKGFVASARVLAVNARPATFDEAEAFGVPAGADLFELERLRMLDGVPVAVDHFRMPLSYAPDLMQRDFSTESLYAALSDLGLRPVRAETTVQAVPADSTQAELLDIAAGAPLLLVSNRCFSAAKRLVELSQAAHRGDRYRFRSTLKSLV